MKKLIACIVLLAVPLVGCQHGKLEKAVKDVQVSNKDKTENALDELDAFSGQDDPIVVFEDKPFVGTRSVAVREPLPDLFSEKVVLQELVPVSLDVLSERLSRISGLKIHFADDVENPYGTAEDVQLKQIDSANSVVSQNGAHSFNQEGLELRVSYEGALAGLLDHIASSLNIDWDYVPDDQEIVFQRFWIKSFRLFATPEIDGLLDRSMGSNGPTLKLDKDVWEATVDDVENLLSEGGSVTANEAGGLLVVRDTKRNLDLVSEYVDHLNSGLQRMVVVKVEVLSVRDMDSEARGLSWDMLFEELKTKVNVTTAASSIPNVSNILVEKTGNQHFTGSQAVISSLEEFGRVGVVTTATVRTLNNQVVPIKNGQKTSYVSNSTQVDQGNGQTTTSLTLSELDTGFSMNLLPSIMDDGETMLLQIGLELSELVELASISTSDTLVQAPTVNTRSFIQKLNVKSGETLVMTGFELHDSRHEVAGTINKLLWFLGGNKLLSDKEETLVVLITPTIINSIKKV